MDINKLFKHKAFNQLEPGQLQLLRQFAIDIRGKGARDIAKLYMQLNQKISQIKPITATQRNEIVEAIRSFLPEDDKQKLSVFMKMLSR